MEASRCLAFASQKELRAISAESRIRELVLSHLADNHQVDGIRFLEQLLVVASEAGALKCMLVGNRQLRFELPDQPAWTVELDRAKSKLRMLCARLAVLCNHSADQQVSPYGGDGVIAEGHPEKWAVRFKNTPSEQEFLICKAS